MPKPLSSDPESLGASVEPSSIHWLPTRAMAGRIALAYAAVASVWILCSGWALHRLVHDPVRQAFLEHVKGWLFVAVTAALLGWVLDRYFAELRRAARWLHESDRRWRFALEGVGQGMWDWDVPANDVFYSPQWKRLLGFGPLELGRGWAEWEGRLHPEDRARVQAELQAHLDGRAPVYVSEHRVVCKDGTCKWILEHGQVMRRNPAGQPLRVVGTQTDITQRQHLETLRQALLSLGAKLNRTRDPVGAGHALLETADQLWKWDSATLDLLQPGSDHVQPVLRVDVVDGRRQDLVQTELLTEPTPRMRRIMAHGAQLLLRDDPAATQSDSLPFGDNARRSASIMCVPIRREQQTVGILSIQSYRLHAYSTEDLQVLQALADYCGGALERIQVEQALQRSEERYRGLVETTFDWIWEVDAAGRYTYASPKIHALLGYAPEEVLGRTPFELMPEDEAERVRTVFQDLAARRQAFSALENTNRHRDGHLVVLETSGVPVLGPNGELRGYRGMDRDVTERKHLEAQLRQAQKLEAVGQLAGGVAHDFNNILAAVMMQLGLLGMNPDLDEETRLALNELDAEARRAANLTRQLLMFSRRSVLAIQPLDLDEVAGNLLKMLRRLIGEHIELRFDGQGALPRVEADAGMMEQVLLNLVVNARDAMPKGGRITIRTSVLELAAPNPATHPDRRPGRFVCLAVSDTGCGMDPLMLKRIFEPFFTTKEPGKGTGLGLATIHGIVAQHKGWVEVESAVGAGATFRVYLPTLAEPAAAVPPPARAAEPIRRGGETILVVEDEPKVRLLVARALQALGYRVHQAANGQEAMILWQRHGPEVDLLLTDMVMPEGMTGLELAEQLQALKPGLQAIISSGYSAEMVQSGLLTKAGIVYLPKPYEAKVLGDVVRDCLDQRGRCPG